MATQEGGYFYLVLLFCSRAHAFIEGVLIPLYKTPYQIDPDTFSIFKPNSKEENVIQFL